MNSTTTTVMQRRGPRFSVALKPRASWADPSESIDSAFPASLETQRGKFGQLVKYYLWVPKGPALTAYALVETKIQDCLSYRDDLFEGEAESALPNSIDCFMVGRTPESASPCIAVSCESKKYCRKVITILKDTGWWANFSDEYPAFKFVHLRNRPRPIRKALHHEDGFLVYTTQSLLGSGTVPLFFFKSAPLSNLEPRLPDSTMGGIIFLDDEPFGLTIAHALHPTPATIHHSCTFDESDRESTFSFVDDSDDDYTCYSGTIPAETDYISEHSGAGPRTDDSEASSSIQTETKHHHSNSFVLLGKIVQASDGTASDDVDWALIAFDEGWEITLHTESLSQDLQYESRTATVGKINNLEAVKMVSESQSLDCAKPIFIRSSTGDTVAGSMKATSTLVGLEGSAKLLNLRTVLLDRAVLSGECGRWVVDAEGNWYGHVVAAEPGSNIAYVASASKIIRAIEIATDKRATAVDAFTSAVHPPLPFATGSDTRSQTVDQQTTRCLIDDFEDEERETPSKSSLAPAEQHLMTTTAEGTLSSEPSNQKRPSRLIIGEDNRYEVHGQFNGHHTAGVNITGIGHQFEGFEEDGDDRHAWPQFINPANSLTHIAHKNDDFADIVIPGPEIDDFTIVTRGSTINFDQRSVLSSEYETSFVQPSVAASQILTGAGTSFENFFLVPPLRLTPDCTPAPRSVSITAPRMSSSPLSAELPQPEDRILTKNGPDFLILVDTDDTVQYTITPSSFTTANVPPTASG